MAEKRDFRGLKFNKLLVIGDAPSKRTPCGDLERRVMVKCECGNEKDVAWKSVKRGKIKSCGCLTPEKIDIEKDNKYGFWTVLEEAEPYIGKDGKSRKVKVQCICGEEKELILSSLRQGSSNSCGCMTEHKTRYQNVSVDSPIPELTLEQMNQRKLHHSKVVELISAKRNENREIIRTVKAECKCGYTKGAILEDVGNSKQCITCAMDEIKSKISDEDRRLKTRLTGVYRGMKSRCYRAKNKDYINYGGRGIKIEESFNTFTKFYELMISQGYTFDCKLEIDRKDNNGNYSADNCRLLSRTDNNRNMRRNVMTWELVERIRFVDYIGVSSKQIAFEVGCSESNINSVKRFKTWNK